MSGGYSDGPLFEKRVHYTLKPRELYSGQDKDGRFPLEFEPRLKNDDSYTLEMRFCWRGDPELTSRLEICRLAIPPELESVERVDSGRYDMGAQEVIWRNLVLNRPARAGDFNNGTVTLAFDVAFRQPLLNPALLKERPVLTGQYRCVFDGLISGLHISHEHIWCPTGRRAIHEGSLVSIRSSSVIEGMFTIDLRRLLQDHEYVRSAMLTCAMTADHDLVKRVLYVLVHTCNIDIQRIERAAPRLDPLGTLETQLHYWDIVGRQYNPDMLNAIGVHGVLAGTNNCATAANGQPTQLDIRVRSRMTHAISMRRSVSKRSSICYQMSCRLL